MNEDYKYKIIADYTFDWETWEDQDGILRHVSPSCKNISGYSDIEFLNNPRLFETIILKEDLEIWHSHRREIHNKLKLLKTQFRIVHKDGHIVWIEHLCQTVIDEEKTFLGYRAKNRDITQHKLSIENLIENELQFQRIIDTLPFSLSIITLEGVVLYVNPKGIEYFEITKDIIGKREAAMHWINPERRLLWIERIKKEGIVTDFEMHIRTALGKELWAMGSGIIINYQGQVAVLSTQHDITERKEMEESLRRSEEKYKLLFENATESIVLVQNGRIILSNEMASILMGYSAEELPKHHFLMYIHPDDADLVYSNHKRRIKGEPVDRIYSFRLLKKDGSTRWIEMNSLKINWEGQAATFNLLSDITEKKLAQDALRVSEEKYRLLFENAVESIVVIQDAYIKICNPMTATLTGYTLEELKNIRFTDFVYEEDINRTLDFHKKRLKGISEGTKQQFRIVKKHGEIRWIESDGIKIDWNGKEASLQFAIDITDRKSKEEEIMYLSYYDQLTGLYNRRFYEEELKRLDVDRNLPLTLVMADVNGLKLTNDAFGHIYGDELLKEVANAIKKELRPEDILARIGGDEFVILLPKTDKIEAKMIVQRVKDKISKINIKKISASVSFGHETKYDRDENIEKVFSRAENYMYRRKLLESASMKSEMITLITRSLHERDRNEQLHSERVASLCKLTAEAMNLEGYKVAEIVLLGMLHDIGKIGLNKKIIASNIPHSEKELCEIRKHPETGYHILKSVSEFSHIAEYVLCHHERPDGKGYPRGLKANTIPLQTKILSISEAYDSMVNNHYKEAISQSKAIEELRSNSGKQFDKEIVDIFIEKVLKTD